MEKVNITYTPVWILASWKIKEWKEKWKNSHKRRGTSRTISKFML